MSQNSLDIGMGHTNNLEGGIRHHEEDNGIEIREPAFRWLVWLLFSLFAMIDNEDSGGNGIVCQKKRHERR
jgi:hypothetical protein